MKQVRSFFVFLHGKCHYCLKNGYKKTVPPSSDVGTGSFLCGENKMYEVYTDKKRNVIFLDETDSTNNNLKKLVRADTDPVFAVIAARRQTGGRGRLGRSFFSPEGGLYFSFSVPLRGDEKNIPFLTTLAGLSVSEAIEELTGIKTQIKWPNDIYLDGKKLGGILCELVFGKFPTAVIGVGINLNVKKEEIPPELSHIMTSFAVSGIPAPDEKLLIDRITAKTDGYVYDKGELFSVNTDTARAVKKRSYSIGKKVKYTVGDTVTEGIITDILDTGAAVITLPDGSEKEIFCGEITG